MIVIKRRGQPHGRLASTFRELSVTVLLLLAPVLSFALLAAHFYRSGSWWWSLASVALALLLALPRAWVARLAQVALVAGAVEWFWTAFALVQQRIALNQPWLRLALILGAVALLTAASALVFRTARLQSRYLRT
jgi:ABC-type dipeptide/oligopeptide/nickel transport system permease component